MRLPHGFSAALTLLALASQGCGAGINEPPPLADHLQIVSGDDQVAATGRDLALPLRVRVIGSNGLPMANIAVSWSISEGGAVLHHTELATDVTGKAGTRLTVGSTAGWIVVVAGVENVTPVAFSSRAVDQLGR
jgi:hypothetical protein